MGLSVVIGFWVDGCRVVSGEEDQLKGVVGFLDVVLPVVEEVLGVVVPGGL